MIERMAKVLYEDVAMMSWERATPATRERYYDRVLLLLFALREPTPEMAAAGDVAVWRAMIDAALGGERSENVSGP